MRYKISNIATRKQLELFANAKFRFPKIYKSKPVYTGLEEELLSIITQENRNEINYGIWGILPHNYNQDWQEFQNIKQTLTVVYNDIKFNEIIDCEGKSQRCVILVTGFFTNLLKNGTIYPYYVYEKNTSPFYIAGYYNVLEDGFITVTIALKDKETYFNNILNLSKYIPKVLSEKEKNMWLSKNITDDKLEALVNGDASIELQSHPIAKELFKMNIFYESILRPINFNS